MTWKCHLTIFKAESPVHIGYRQIGILKTTRYYITGRAMWGAITANLTRALFSNPDPEDYQEVGNFVKENIRTTYFYPAVKKDETGSENLSKYEVNGYSTFLPEYTDKGLMFGNESKDWFEQTFVNSFVSTAIETQTKTAEEGSLHEIENIRNKVNLAGEVIQVYWVGYLFVNYSANEKIKLSEKEDDVVINFNNGSVQRNTSLKNVLDLIFVGGERNYGFGRLRLIPDSSNFKTEDQRLFKKFPLKLGSDKNGGKAAIEIDSTSIALAHVDIGDWLNEQFMGDIEPLVGREWGEKGSGQKISQTVKICITPGSRFTSDKSFSVGNFGIWEVI
ncbi:hypothetical protein DRQ00_09905 [candidate division KSB1 bacterium]|nr:MAG: hypothetical protein DRQ00_09905 [candidate division KSB1 bacterium]